MELLFELKSQEKENFSRQSDMEAERETDLFMKLKIVYVIPAFVLVLVSGYISELIRCSSLLHRPK